MANYMRIQGRELSYRTQKPVGIFHLAGGLLEMTFLVRMIKKYLLVQTSAFKDDLPEPSIYSYNNSIGAITYFKVDDTAFMFEKLEPIMDLFKKHNVAFDIVYTDFIGKIIYEDEYQVAVIDV